ncbi:uncharacterized protein LOC106873661 [Octopus bimaculoides]|uniref:uncharacterized protein LOC106873661 n=1 Tax=Octopus bimaculoides TaxID=37653 RepID=UPI00071C2BFE|nr:uncharacterized protein LOC106873661 [Octopus bimaculoides]|eukprot:XP_014776598.1 PREDICTED: uncharacterized protein LOC106873661 [Octopus bimaculoides]
MFLRNLDATNGNCNGTQYITVSLNDHVIEAKVASGPYAESTLLISRIPLVSQEMEFTFTFTRKQFPVKPAFALTCNKVHKQTLEQIGIYLPTQFFSHGQLYVALPRFCSYGFSQWSNTSDITDWFEHIQHKCWYSFMQLDIDNYSLLLNKALIFAMKNSSLTRRDIDILNARCSVVEFDEKL